MENNNLMIGIITSRKCPTCGHSEIGYETNTGEFCPLKPGDTVGVFPKVPLPGILADRIQIVPEGSKKVAGNASEAIPWIPDPLRCHRLLRCKYGVLNPMHVPVENMSPGIYEIAYRQKLQKLIEQEIYTPLSVIFDRYFSAPHLASGDSKQVADAMWEELEEIRRPVVNMEKWLENRDEESLAKMILPLSVNDLTEEPVSDEQLKQELVQISLEDFLEMV